ncbi:hypothetical protein AACH06_11250 [Ideonella sp. DXS29W]|uniref:Uncharacterized protein n=1 Tax=Ideonella lacteola TaxID=2984193 RepID=A0ABU9BR49_9BURK
MNDNVYVPWAIGELQAGPIALVLLATGLSLAAGAAFDVEPEGLR